ncbi:MAG: hypothetical protein AAF490_30265 [Chloroflexota bacterium]
MTKHKISRWIIGYAILQLILAVLFGARAYLNRSFQFPKLVGNEDALFAIGLFANRNLGVSVALIAGLVLRSRPMVMIIFIARFATDAFDFLLAIFGTGVEGAGALSETKFLF